MSILYKFQAEVGRGELQFELQRDKPREADRATRCKRQEERGKKLLLYNGQAGAQEARDNQSKR